MSPGAAARAARPIQDFPLLDTVLELPPPWRIERVDLDPDEVCLRVRLGYAAEARWPCPACGQPLSCHEPGAERVWRHLDLCRFRVLLHAAAPRIACPRHGIADIAVPWAGGCSAYTSAMEDLIVVIASSGGVSGASQVLHVQWDDAWRLMMSKRVGV